MLGGTQSWKQLLTLPVLSAATSLVLVHGLQGHEIGSFTDKSTGVCWPRDLLPEAQPRTRVLSFGYNGDVYENTSVAGIRGNANSLLLRLRDARKGVDPGRPCVILGHSLGGLVVKQVRESHSQPEFIARVEQNRRTADTWRYSGFTIGNSGSAVQVTRSGYPRSCKYIQTSRSSIHMPPPQHFF